MSQETPQKPTRRKKSKPDMVLNIEGNFKDFTDFYDENKEIIYKNFNYSV